MPPLHAASHTLVITAVMSGVAGLLFLLVWSLRQREQVYGWFGLMSLVWVYYLSTFLDEAPWTFADTLTRLRSNLAALIVYVLCFCRFTWSFGRQHLPRPERWPTIWALISIAVVALVPVRWAPTAFLSAWLTAAAIFLANCLHFQWRAWRSREPRQLILAGCCLLLFATAVHDMPASFGLGLGSWSAISAPTVTVVIVLLLALQLLTQMRHIESANVELRQHVDTATNALSDALQREHSNAVRHAQLQERLNLAHDLHDGMGSTLVRNMALVEQATQPLPNARILSLLKVLRDDLRQVIDQASTAATETPETPLSWAAPLRARFTRVFEALGMQADWLISPEWRFTPSPLQCLMLSRIVEEALSNVIQHSHADRVQVSLQWRENARLVLIIEDNGQGFDVAAVQASGLSVGLRSMAARVARIGGVWQMTSRPGSTILSVSLAPPGLPA